MWSKNFPNTQILREIRFGKPKTFNTAAYTVDGVVFKTAIQVQENYFECNFSGEKFFKIPHCYLQDAIFQNSDACVEKHDLD